MDFMGWVVLGVFTLGLVSLAGFFCTKESGFGRFSTSTLLLLLVVSVSTLLFAAGKLQGQVMANILFAVIGFAGGLFTGETGGHGQLSDKKSEKPPQAQKS